MRLMKAGSQRGAACIAVLASCATVRSEVGQELGKLLAEDGAASDGFGSSVALRSATALVGAPGDDDNGVRSGSAYLFDAATGVQLRKLLPGDGATDDAFGRVVALGEDVALVGAPWDDGNGYNAGAAYLFDVDTGLQLAKILADDGQYGDFFGASVSISGRLALIAARGDDDKGPDAGSAYLFDISDPARPRQVAKLLADDGAPGDAFGSVAIRAATALIGVWADQDMGPYTGSAYLFDLGDPARPRQIAKLLADDGRAGDGFGYSVAIGATAAVVGAPWDDDGTGAIYIFEAATGRRLAKVVPDDRTPGDLFGLSVAIDGGSAVIGAFMDGDNGFASGSAYLFDLSEPSAPHQTAKLLAADGVMHDWFGISVAIDGAATLIGAPGDDDNGHGSGSAYVFSAGCPADFNGDGDANSRDFIAFLNAFAAGDRAADFNGDGIVDSQDLIAFLNAFVDGC